MRESVVDREVRELLHAVRDDARGPVPPFRRLWSRAESASRPRRSLRGPALAVAAASVMAIVLVVLPLLSGGGGPAPITDPMEIARSLSEWEAPLEFLLEVPGAGLYSSSLDDAELGFELPPLTFEAMELQEIR